jgi:hypothetical protein
MLDFKIEHLMNGKCLGLFSLHRSVLFVAVYFSSIVASSIGYVNRGNVYLSDDVILRVPDCYKF